MLRLLLYALIPSLLLGTATSGRADNVEDEAVAFVKKLGGEVIRDEKLPGKPATVVSLFSTKVTDAGLKELAPLNNFATLELSETTVTDVGLKEVAALKTLTKLYLKSTKVTKAGVTDIQKALPRCKIEWDGGVIEPTQKP